MSAYFKSVLRSVRNSLARFIAIFAIIALGVGFFAGLKLTMPSFISTGNEFVNSTSLYDFRLLSTIGFTEEDVDQISQVDGVRAVSGAVFYDVMMLNSGKADQLSTVRFHSLTEGIDTPKLICGRMPASPNEVVADEYRLTEDWIGRTLIVSDENSGSTKDALVYDEYVIVGLVRSPYYMNFQRPNTDVGSGSVEFYVYGMEEAFDFEYYSEVYVKYETDPEIYSDEYEAFADQASRELEKKLETVIGDRFDGLLQDAYGEAFDARDEFKDKLAEAGEELGDARAELDDAAETLNSSKQELADALAELQDGRRTLDDSLIKLDDAQRQLSDSEAQIESGRSRLDSAQSEIDSNRLAVESARNELEANLAAVNSGISQTQQTKSGLESDLAHVDSVIEELENELQLLIQAREDGSDVDDLIAQAEAGIEEAQQSRQQILSGIEACEAAAIELNGNLAAINAGLEEVDRNQAALDAAQQTVDASRRELEDGIRQYRAGLAEYSRGMSEYSTGEAKYNDGLEEYNRYVEEYNDGFTQYYDGVRDLISAQEELGAKMCDAARQLEYAFREIDKTPRPDTYVLGRDTNVGYVSFDNDSRMVDGIAQVFPVFFFALAALVCSTTMSRMIGDERTQIGTMRALGYSDFAIVMKYVIYSGTAAVSGCCAGYAAGAKVFPYVIWEVYRMMYGFADVIFRDSIWVFLISLLVSVACSIGVTAVTCLTELKGMPADLIRPKAPAAGKRILLERIPFVWKNLKFLHKVSFRNVFRFKKRMWMMITGIAGSTSLLLTGFGLRDSINDIVNLHYDNVMTYDLSMVFDKEKEADIRQAVDEANDERHTEYTMSMVEIKSVQHQGSDMIRDVSLVISDDANVTSFVRPREYGTGNPLPWPEDGTAAISSKLAKRNDLKAGDTITFTWDDGAKSMTCRIGYVFENYIFHYAFISGKTYEDLTGERFVPDQALIRKDTSEVTPAEFATSVCGLSNVKLWSLTSGSRESFDETIKQLNAVVILVIVCAAALAFIVMFNLNNINMTERIREIATLKVMGFNRLETGSYVFRENIILVMIGFVFGIPLGLLLHSFVIRQIEMDTVTFVPKVLLMSYILSIVFMVIFTVIVDLIMRIRIEKIDMAESLKSVE